MAQQAVVVRYQDENRTTVQEIADNSCYGGSNKKADISRYPVSQAYQTGWLKFFAW